MAGIAGFALVVLVIGTAIVWRGPSFAPTEQASVIRTAPSVPTGMPSWWEVPVPAGVGDLNNVMVWTGSDLIFWGGNSATDNRLMGEPGAAYSPDRDEWRMLAASPKPVAYGAAGIWTGSEVIISGGTGTSRPRSAAAYNPQADTWRLLSEAPVAGDFTEATWSGDEMLAVSSGGVAGFDPTTNQWRTFPSPPERLGRLNEIAWTGSELIVWPADVEYATRRGMALETESGNWRLLPPPPAWPAAPDIAWTDGELVVWGADAVTSDRIEVAGSILSAGTNEWQLMPNPPRLAGPIDPGSQALLWTGQEVLIYANELLLSYDPAINAWAPSLDSPISIQSRSFADVTLAESWAAFRTDALYMFDLTH